MRWNVMLVPAALSLLFACGDGVTDGGDVPGAVTEVIVTPAEAQLLVGQELQLEVRPEDKRGSWVEKAECTWSTADAMVVEVGSGGLAKGISPGSAAVAATCDGVTGSALLRVDSLILEFSEYSSAVLYAVGGSSATDVFAVGSNGVWWDCCETIVHYDGMGWSDMAVPNPDWPAALLGVWASSAHDVFAVGEHGTMLHHDGTAWAVMGSGTASDLGGIWGSSPNDVFAVGGGRTILHYDGLSWTPMSVPSGSALLTGIWGSSGTDVFAVGQDGAVLHYDGASWVEMYNGGFSLNAVWGSSATDVFAVGAWGTVLHYDGTSWKRLTVPTTHSLTGVWGTADSNLFVVGTDDWLYCSGLAVVLHYDGVSWGVTETEIPACLLGAWGTSEDVFLVGAGATVLRVNR